MSKMNGIKTGGFVVVRYIKMLAQNFCCAEVTASHEGRYTQGMMEQIIWSINYSKETS